MLSSPILIFGPNRVFTDARTNERNDGRKRVRVGCAKEQKKRSLEKPPQKEKPEKSEKVLDNTPTEWKHFKKEEMKEGENPTEKEGKEEMADEERRKCHRNVIERAPKQSSAHFQD